MNVLKQRNCLITGASRGLGAKIAAAFWEAGANLMLVARTASALKQVADGLPRRADQRVITYAADLSDPQAPEQIIAEARKEFGALDVLVNNAGIQGPIGPCWENDWQAWQTTLQVNLLAPIALCRLCVPWMAQRGRGKIVNLSGGGATGPRPNFSAYATAKVGLVRFSETLAKETHSMRIEVNCIAPGAMDTAMLAAIVEAGPEAAGQREYELAVKACSTGEATLVRAVALCMFLASSASDGITGKLISAVWDPWETLPNHLEDLRTDVYTLRRIVPKDRGMRWGEAK
jgi:3-oxoacyl-[acyl-carrier protein] reductase